MKQRFDTKTQIPLHVIWKCLDFIEKLFAGALSFCYFDLKKKIKNEGLVFGGETFLGNLSLTHTA